ncbi:MAG TPA: phosphatase [Gammaproteobacteria bacterium]|nr:phosphatase [Gammaproteobacteria bacterium]
MPGEAEVERSFSAVGGTFLTPAAELTERLRGIRGLVFDWDGVFNSGAKGEGVASTFSEADSMGVNLLRFALWRAQRALPVAALISGENNPSARRFAEREHFHAAHCGAKQKTAAFEALCEVFGLDGRATVCVFDDVNDLGMAERSGIRVLVRRDASPLLRDYVVRHGLCDYMTGSAAHGHAVREVAELLLGLMGGFDGAVRSRVAWDGEYARYFEARQAVETQWFGVSG